MSTASWTIDRETAEIIMPSGRDSFDMDRAWPRNGALWSANSYEWCHPFDGGIECAKCGIERAKEAEGEEYDLRKVPTGDGGWGLEFCTYEFTEMMHCDCGVTLGGWEDVCSICDELCSTYDDAKLHLFGYIGDMEFMGGHLYKFVATADDMPPDDIIESLDPICVPCLDHKYEYDHFKDAIASPIYDGLAWKIERIDEESK